MVSIKLDGYITTWYYLIGWIYGKEVYVLDSQFSVSSFPKIEDSQPKSNVVLSN